MLFGALHETAGGGGGGGGILLAWGSTEKPRFYSLQWHHNIWAMASQITGVSIGYSTIVQAHIKEHIIAPRHWPLWENSPFTGEFSAQRTRNAEIISIWWRHPDFHLTLSINWRQLQCGICRFYLHRSNLSLFGLYVTRLRADMGCGA